MGGGNKRKSNDGVPGESSLKMSILSRFTTMEEAGAMTPSSIRFCKMFVIRRSRIADEEPRGLSKSVISPSGGGLSRLWVSGTMSSTTRLEHWFGVKSEVQ